VVSQLLDQTRNSSDEQAYRQDDEPPQTEGLKLLEEKSEGENPGYCHNLT